MCILSEITLLGLWYFQQCLWASGFLWENSSEFEQRFVDDTKRDGFSQFSFAAWILYIVKAGDEINVSLQDS